MSALATLENWLNGEVAKAKAIIEPIATAAIADLASARTAILTKHGAFVAEVFDVVSAFTKEELPQVAAWMLPALESKAASALTAAGLSAAEASGIAAHAMTDILAAVTAALAVPK